MSFLLDQAKRVKDGLTIWAEWLGNDKHPVDWRKAQDRANVCLKCPLNQEGNVVTEALAGAIKRQMELKKALHLHVMGEKSLHTCQACGCPLKLKLWENFSRIAPDDEEKKKLDPGCWLLSEQL